MKALILNAIKRQPITLSELEARAAKRGVSLEELYQVLEIIHRDKRVKTTTKGDDVTYSWQEPRPKPGPPQRPNYPHPPECEHGSRLYICAVCRPFPEVNLSFMFIRPGDINPRQGRTTVVEYDQYGRRRKQDTIRDIKMAQRRKT